MVDTRPQRCSEGTSAHESRRRHQLSLVDSVLDLDGRCRSDSGNCVRRTRLELDALPFRLGRELEHRRRPPGIHARIGPSASCQMAASHSLVSAGFDSNDTRTSHFGRDPRRREKQERSVLTAAMNHVATPHLGNLSFERPECDVMRQDHASSVDWRRPNAPELPANSVYRTVTLATSCQSRQPSELYAAGLIGHLQRMKNHSLGVNL